IRARISAARCATERGSALKNLMSVRARAYSATSLTFWRIVVFLHISEVRCRMKPTLRPYFDHIIVVAFAALCYPLFFYALGCIGCVGSDEPSYAAIACEMLVSGDYITPRLYGAPWFEKPLLMYWVAALGYKIFGMNETGVRFASALGATMCVFLV